MALPGEVDRREQGAAELIAAPEDGVRGDGDLAAVMDGLTERGAEAIVLGCIEIGMLVGPGDAAVPIVDSTQAHARQIVDLSLAALRGG